jgi:Holliday junction resolvasome RuvABC endonuclease subunit
MRCCGIDNAKIGYKAIALAVNGVPVRAHVWKPPNKLDSAPTILEDSYDWLRRWLKILKPDVIAVEQLQVFQNKKVIRALSQHEGVALLAAKQSGGVVIQPGTSQSRGVVFSAGNLSKDDAWVAFRKMYPDFVLLAKNSGGSDQMDAMTHALAAPTILERLR